MGLHLLNLRTLDHNMHFWHIFVDSEGGEILDYWWKKDGNGEETKRLQMEIMIQGNGQDADKM